MGCTASVVVFYKDPTEILDYQIDWAPWLGSNTIATSVWTIPTGITNVNDTNDTTTTTIWISGGTLGESYELINTITSGSRTAKRTFTWKIIDR